MTDLSSHGLPYLAVVLNATTALVWGTLAFSYCRCHGTSRPQATVLQLFRFLGYLFAAYYGSKVVIDLLWSAEGLSPWFQASCIFAELTMIILLSVMRHLVLLGTLGAPRPSRLWLLVNYGFGCVMWPLGGVPHDRDGYDFLDIYLTVMAALILWDLVRLARQRRRPILMADLKFTGYLIYAVVLFGGVIVLLLTESERTFQREQSLAWVLAHSFVGLASAAPFALRILGEMVRSLLLNGLKLCIALGVYGGLQILRPLSSGDRVSHLLALLAAALLLVVLGPGSQVLARLVDLLLWRNSHQWRRQLRTVLHQISPAAGIESTSRQAADSVTEVMGLRGAAILLDDPTRVVESGNISIESLVPLWTGARAAEALPEGIYDLVWLDDVELQIALHDAKITWLGPIVSPTRHWGYLFVTAGLFGSAAAHTKLEILADLSRELGLMFDAADSLARIRQAERDLAHHEKLAALGESAARIAHEIRNPVTAARSLAQLLAEEPTSPQNAEHAALVVRELDRVEARVQAMLQFAKPEHYRFEPLTLADEIRRTVGELETYPDFQGIQVELAVDSDGKVRADSERLRQVIVNLISNSVDALKNLDGERRLKITLTSSATGVILEVTDNGLGIPAEILPRIFEPFVSSKARGAGLGLAIAKRIVEDHGGHIEVVNGENRGTEIRIELPKFSAHLPDLSQAAVA